MSVLQVVFPCPFLSHLGISVLLGWGHSWPFLSAVQWDYKTPIPCSPWSLWLFLQELCCRAPAQVVLVLFTNLMLFLFEQCSPAVQPGCCCTLQGLTCTSVLCS